MEEDDVILIVAVGIFGYFLYSMLAPASSGETVGTFSPDAPDTFEQIVGMIMPQSISQSGVSFLKNQEGFSPFSYQDGAKRAIGYGHDILPGETFVEPISAAEGDDLLTRDLQPMQAAIQSNVSVPLTQGQYDALCSFVYNVGIGAFKASTLLRDLNMGDYSSAANEFGRWVHSSGAVNPVLVDRRGAEADIFNGTGTYG